MMINVTIIAPGHMFHRPNSDTIVASIQQLEPNCTAVHCTALHCSALQCIALHFNAVQCTALHCTALHCIQLF